MTHRLREIARLLGLVAALPCAAAAQRGSIAGKVTIRGSDIPIGYAVIALQSPAREQFTGSDGAFSIRDVPAGHVRLVAKRIGYAPLDTTVDVAANDTLRLAIELPLVTAQLPAIHSLAERCSHPGENSVQLGLELASLFDQVKQNADRHRLLARSYPFELLVERKITKPEPVLEARFIAFDTVRVSSVRAWRYAPGKMLGTREYGPGIFAGKWMTITMPELADFADDTFLNNHCFDYGGTDLVDGDTLLRVEFVPAPRVRDPDVAGTLFLDPHTFQIRLAMMSVVNPNKQMRKVTGGQAIRAVFREVIPGVPVLDLVSSLVFAPDDPKVAPVEPSSETQRTLSVKFLKGKP